MFEKLAQLINILQIHAFYAKKLLLGNQKVMLLQNIEGKYTIPP
jgi:hypothetical protein